MIQKQCLLLLFTALFFTSCQPAKQTVTSFQITSLKALDLEESLTRSDELLLAYTLTALDEKGHALAISTGSWGVQEARKAQIFPEKSFQPIQIPIPKNGKVVATVVLIEVDDYEKAQKTLAEIKKYHDYIRIPAGLAELADVALTPIKYLSLGLSAAGIGFQVADRLDDDDVLGQVSREYTHQQILASPTIRVPLTFTSTHLGSSFHYEMEFDLRSQSVRVVPRPKSKTL